MKIIPNFIKQEKFEDTKVETRSCKQQNNMTNFLIHPLFYFLITNTVKPAFVVYKAVTYIQG
jgi:hypothetical protein